MKPSDLRSKLSRGVISFPVTPFKKDLSLDLEGHRRNLRFILKFPLTAIVAPAGCGRNFSFVSSSKYNCDLPEPFSCTPRS